MNDEKLIERKIDSKEIFSGHILDLRVDTVELPDGGTAPREVVHHRSCGAAAVLPLLDDGSVLLVRQFRYPFSRVMLEIPAGKLDAGEDPLVCAKRELLEETGGVAENYVFLGEMYPSVAFLDEVLYLYAASDITFSEQNLDEDEFVEVVKMPFEELLRLVTAGEVKDAKTIIAALKTDILKKNGGI